MRIPAIVLQHRSRCSWRGHLRGAHIYYSPVFLEGTPARGTYSLQLGVLGGDTCEGYIFISAWVFLEGTSMMGKHGFHYCPSVLGGDTYDGFTFLVVAAVYCSRNSIFGDFIDIAADFELDQGGNVFRYEVLSSFEINL
nr:hypothetical protein [Tanacetum cinerariifolium]